MNNKRWDALYLNGTIVSCEANENPYGLLHDAALAVSDDQIEWLGRREDLPDSPDKLALKVYDMDKKCMTPGLIDCHTHLVFGGNRCIEFEMRLLGATYEDIALAGGGIRSTVAATRSLPEEVLFEQSLQRARFLFEQGVTTIEIKSGYGLDLDTELKILRVIKKISESLPITVFPTFLGAHALPLEYQWRSDEYIDLVCNKMIPRVAEEKLAQAVDVFCETIGFNLKQTKRVFDVAKKYNLQIKCHSEQLSNSGSALLAAEYQALSVDHLEFLSGRAIPALAMAGTVAVLLPGAFYFLREKQVPPIEALRSEGVPIAIATDCNPGTSPVSSLLLMLNMACTLFGLTPEEALLGVTRHAAKALGMAETHGTLTVGKKADFVIWDISHPAELAYWVGKSPVIKIVKAGKVVWEPFTDVIKSCLINC